VETEAEVEPANEHFIVYVLFFHFTTLMN
jgi:hypothetical protein